jgi:hypothetical protein
MEPVVEATFEWLISLVSAIAVQANCMDVLWNLRTRYNWVADELREQIGFLMKTGGPGIQVRGRKVLGKMRDVSGI